MRKCINFHSCQTTAYCNFARIFVHISCISSINNEEGNANVASKGNKKLLFVWKQTLICRCDKNFKATIIPGGSSGSHCSMLNKVLI